jgi:serine protease Do
VAAGFAAVILFSSASGAGASWYVMRNFMPEPAVTQQAPPVSESQADAPRAVTPGLSPAAAGDITSVVQKTSGSVVEITTESKQTGFFVGEYVTQGAGSGVVVSEDGYIVTNDHVIAGATAVTVRLPDGTEYEASLVGTDPQTDLAVIKIEAGGLAPVRFADSDQVQVGQLAVAIGNPLGSLGGTVTSGIISAKDREITIQNESTMQSETMTLLQTSAAINPGNSGGGLFNQNGELVGIVNAKSAGSEIEGLGFAIPSNTVQDVMADMIDVGYVTGRPQLGITAVEVNDIRTAMELQVSEPGVYVYTTQEGNNLEELDRFVSIDGWKITARADLTEILKQHKVGDTLSVVLVRDREEITVEVTLSEKVPEGVEPGSEVA